jgi:hypothetical protein
VAVLVENNHVELNKPGGGVEGRSVNVLREHLNCWRDEQEGKNAGDIPSGSPCGAHTATSVHCLLLT